MVNAAENIVAFIISTVRILYVEFIVSITVYQWVLNPDLSSWCNSVSRYARSGRNIGMIILISIDLIVEICYYLIELVGIELF